MFHFFRSFWPSTLRVQLMLVLLPIVGLPIIATGYLLREHGYNTFIAEKQARLQGIADLLDQHLKAQGGYEGLLEGYNGPQDRARKIAYLNQQLRAYCDQVATAFPDIGVGYFHRELDAIITYAPSKFYEKTVGESIAPQHPGRDVMAQRIAMTVSGDQVRGNIMNAMRPIIEGEKVVGYIWANELLDDIARQTSAMRFAMQTTTLIGFGLSLIVVYFVIAQLAANVERIKKWLLLLRFDLSTPTPPVRGEMGEVVLAIDMLAEALKEARSMHHNILDSLADAVITVDSKNQVSYINPAASALFGRSALEAVGHPYTALFHPDAAFQGPILDTLVSHQEHRGIELDYPLTDRRIKVLASTSLLYDGKNQPVGAVAIIRDMSEQDALKQKVAQHERLAVLGEMVAGIAHELRTPLTSIRGFVQYLQGSSDPLEWQEYGNIIIREVDGLNRIVSELLDLVRIQPLYPALTNINGLLQETLFLARERAGKQGIHFVSTLAEDLPPLMADGGRIKQLFLNILMNAIESIKHEGEVSIETKGHDNTIEIRISDNGCGIPEKVLERIFDPFFSTKPEGTGLGMAIAQRIVESHQGNIKINSIVGQGTVVTVRLPLETKTG